MLTLLLSPNWRANRQYILQALKQDVAQGLGNRILLVPEQASHDYERRLCQAAGDTASRYAQVLSFTRLGDRIFSLYGGCARATLDKGGRLLAMGAAIGQLRPRLKAYAAAGNRPEFLSALLTAVDEFKSCCITPETLSQAAEQLEGSLAQKTQELALVLEGYNAVCNGAGLDAQDRLELLLQQLEAGDFGQEHTFYLDGFSDFTARELEILGHLLEVSPSVTIALSADELQTDTVGMELPGRTGAQLLSLATQKGIRYEVRSLPDPEAGSGLGAIHRNLLGSSAAPVPGLERFATARRFGSIQEECTYVAAQIRQGISRGLRYRDFSLVLTDPQRYTPVLRQALSQFGIPAYFAGTENILGQPVIFTITAALDAVTGAQEQQDILRYLKSPLSPLTPDQCDRLENYAIAWSIRGKAWTVPFTKHPRGLKQDWTQEDLKTLDTLNHSRELGITPLVHLRQGLQGGDTVLEQLTGLYQFLDQVQLSQRLERLAQEAADRGDQQKAQALEQLWQILMGAMNQMAALLGESHLEPEAFVGLFRLLLSQYTVGTIPQTLDSVTAGGIVAMRRQESKHLFLLGAQEGLLPQGAKSGMVLTESERKHLMDLGVPLQGDLYHQLELELSGIYAVLLGATETVTLTTGTGLPSRVYRRLCRMLDRDSDQVSTLSPLERSGNDWSAACYHLQAKSPVPHWLQTQGDVLARRAVFDPGRLEPDTVGLLYGKELRLSASQIEKEASCRFAYFLRYGLHLKERKELSLDPSEFGTFVHEVLERTARTVMERGGFREVSLEETLDLAMAYAKTYYEEHFSQLEDLSQRQNYLFQRNQTELRAVVQELWSELSQSSFVPAGFEVKFGPDGQMPPVEIPGGAMKASVLGFVDRLDTYEKDGKTYVRVVDYKTGKKDFDYCDILCGLGLQMLIYLFALADGGEHLLGTRPEPAGVLYFPARCPVEPMKGPAEEEEVEKNRRKRLKRQGLVLAEGEILGAMDATEDLRFLPVKAGKSGALSGDLASEQQFRQLKHHLMGTLAGLVDQIAGGKLSPDPHFRGDHDACRYCEFAAGCHLDLWGEKREYRKIDQEEFWQVIQKEDAHGN